MRRIIWLCLTLLAVLVLSGCARRGEETTALTPSEDKVIYYLETDRLTLTTRRYRPVSESFDGMLGEMLDRFQNPSTQEVVSALPESVTINGCTMGVDNLTVDFNAAYLGLTNVQKVLLQAAVVKTLVQLPGVLNVSITVDGQIVRESDGTALLALTESLFLDSQGDGLASDRFATMDLYFASQDGSSIVKEERSFSYSSNIITEQAIAEEIIRGPNHPELLPVVDPDTQINSVSVEEGVCVLDFSSAFNVRPGEDITPEACIYSFVNSICESGSVSGVRFEIDGDSDARLWNQISLDQTFSRDADIILREEETFSETEAGEE